MIHSASSSTTAGPTFDTAMTLAFSAPLALPRPSPSVQERCARRVRKRARTRAWGVVRAQFGAREGGVEAPEDVAVADVVEGDAGASACDGAGGGGGGRGGGGGGGGGGDDGSRTGALGALAVGVAVLAWLGVARFLGGSGVPEVLDMPSGRVGLAETVAEFVEGPHFAVSVGMGLSALIQSMTGFGFAIVSVGALSQVPWIIHSSVFDTIQPVAATLGALTGWVLILPEIRKVKFKDIAVLIAASSITTPVGAVMLEYLDSGTVVRVLGALISGYVAYSVLGIQVSKKLGSKAGAWGLGFVAGALGGAFDITGPALVVHGEAADWGAGDGEFRRNVLTVVSINSTLVVLWDYFSGRLDDYYYWDFVAYAAPTVVVGIILGKFLSTRMDASTFKKVVLGTCAVMGIKLLLP